MTARRFGRIDRRASGRFRIRYEHDGRTISGGTFRTKTEAAEALAAIRTDVARGTWNDPAHGAVTFSEALDAFLEHRMVIGKLRDDRDYRSLARNHLGCDGDRVTGLGRRRLDTITRADVNALVARLVRAGLAPRTTRNVARLLASVLTYAVSEQGWIAANPAAGVSLPRAAAEEMLVLSEAQVHALAAAFPRPDHGLLVRLTVFGGGLRAGEVSGLRVADFDPAAGTVTIRRARKAGQDRETKTAASKRTNVLPGWLADEMRAHCADRPADTPMFTSTEGVPHDHGNWMRRWFKPTAVRIGLPERLRFHDLRHTSASSALARGVPLPAVAAALGHSKPTTTLAIYAHTLPDERGRFAAAFEAPPARLRAVG